MTDMHTDRRLSELGRIVESQQDRLFRFAYMRVGNRPDAEDIVQDVFLRLFRSGERLSHVRSLGHYLLRCVDNGCRDYFRRRSCSLLPESAAGQETEPEDRPMHEEYLRITALLSSIPEEQAEVVRLKCVDGLKFREIAALLGIPLATAKSRYRYGIGHIRDNMDI